MSSMFDEATKKGETQLTKMRWALGLNGLLLVAFGVVILLWPGISVYALTILFGAYCLASGIIALMSAFSSDAAGERVGIAELAVAIGGKRMLESDMKRTFAPKPQTSH